MEAAASDDFRGIVDCICDYLCCWYVVYASPDGHLFLEDKCILKHESTNRRPGVWERHLGSWSWLRFPEVR
jgi:hypothetical protein